MISAISWKMLLLAPSFASAGASCDLCLISLETDLNTLATAAWSSAAVGELKNRKQILHNISSLLYFI
jgi:hypothetical protein